MFDSLSERFKNALKTVSGQGRLSEDNLKKTLKEVRVALLEADVALTVAQDFLARVKRLALGREVAGSLNPGQTFLKIVRRELTTLMGEQNEALDLATQPPAVILMAGLQGSGKTTTSAKLAKRLREQKKKVLLASVDIYRPAAIEQLAILAEQVGVAFHPATSTEKPVSIALHALDVAKRQAFDVLIVDTAGRLHVDETMMHEIKALCDVLHPIETLFVVDSMTGQDAANTAKAFNDALSLTGVILTKIDGDARGGAALSIRAITGKPIKFIGTGEKSDALEPFYPDRIASRILGMGDVFGLIESIEQHLDREKAQKMAKKVLKSGHFSLIDFADQLKEMQNMGGMASIMDKLPGMGKITEVAKSKINDRHINRMIAIVNAMTPKERLYPDLIKATRKVRIAKGAGVAVQDVNRLLKQFEEMQKMMKKMKGGGMMHQLRHMRQMMS